MARPVAADVPINQAYFYGGANVERPPVMQRQIPDQADEWWPRVVAMADRERRDRRRHQLFCRRFPAAQFWMNGATRLSPPLTEDSSAWASLWVPPLTVELAAEALLKDPPRI